MPKKGKGKKKSKKDSEPTEPPHDPGWERVMHPTFTGSLHSKHRLSSTPTHPATLSHPRPPGRHSSTQLATPS